jgi:hypothetical protein
MIHDRSQHSRIGRFIDEMVHSHAAGNGCAIGDTGNRLHAEQGTPQLAPMFSADHVSPPRIEFVAALHQATTLFFSGEIVERN